MTREELAHLRGTEFNEKKKPHGGQKGDLSDHAGQNPTMGSSGTSKLLAEKHGVSKNTIERDAKFAKAVDTIADRDGEDKKALMLTHSGPLTRIPSSKPSGNREASVRPK